LNNIQLNIVANAQFQQVYAEVAKLKSALTTLQQTSVGGPFTSGVQSDIKAAQSQFDSAVLSTRAFTIQQVAMTDSVAKFGQQLSRGQLSLQNYYKIWRDSAKGTSAEIDALATSQARLNRSMAVADPLKPGYAKLVTDINGVVTAEEKLVFQQQALNTALQQGAMKLVDFGKNTQWMGRQLTVGLTMPLAMFGAAASQAYLSFDKQMTQMLQVYGAHAAVQSQATLDLIQKQVTSLADKLARTLGVAMTDTVTVAQTFSSIGLEGQNLIAATEATIRLQKLGNLSAQQASTSMVALQNVFKLQANQIGDAVNFLNAAKHSTSTTMQDIVDALPRVGPIIQQLGGSYKDFTTFLVALKESGVPAAQGANAIKSMLASIINPTTAAQKALSALHINIKQIVADNQGNPMGMVTGLQAALSQLPSEQRLKAIEQVFGKFQFARVTALIDNLGKAGSQSAKVLELYNQSNAQLASVANQELQVSSSGTPAAQFQKMKATLQADLLPLGRSFLQAFTQIGNAVDHIYNAIKGIANMMGPVAGILGKVFGTGFAGLIIIGPVIMLVGLFANLIGNILRGANSIRMFRQGMQEALPTQNAFMAGIKGMRNFYQELDAAEIAARNQMELMPEAITTNAKAFEILRTEIAKLTDQFRLLAQAQNASMSSGLLSSIGTVLPKEGATLLKIVPKKNGGMLPGFNDGGAIYDPSVHGSVVPGPSHINYDSVLASVPVGGFVLNKKASQKNPGLSTLPKFATGGRMLAMLTPGETVFDPLTTAANYDLLNSANSGNKIGGSISSGQSMYGSVAQETADAVRRAVRNGTLSTVQADRMLPGELSPIPPLGRTDISKLQKAHITEDLSGMMIYLPEHLNKKMNSANNGVTGNEVADALEQMLKDNVNPNALMIENAAMLGGDPAAAKEQLSHALSDLIKSLRSQGTHVFGGKDNVGGFERFAYSKYIQRLRQIPLPPVNGRPNNLFDALKEMKSLRSSPILTQQDAIDQGILKYSDVWTTDKDGNIVPKNPKKGDPLTTKGEIVYRKNGRPSFSESGKTQGASLPEWAKSLTKKGKLSATRFKQIATTATGSGSIKDEILRKAEFTVKELELLRTEAGFAKGGSIGAHHRKSPVYSYTGSDVYRGQTRRMKASLGVHYNSYKAPHTRGLKGWNSGGVLGGLINPSKPNYGIASSGVNILKNAGNLWRYGSMAAPAAESSAGAVAGAGETIAKDVGFFSKFSGMFKLGFLAKIGPMLKFTALSFIPQILNSIIPNKIGGTDISGAKNVGLGGLGAGLTAFSFGAAPEVAVPIGIAVGALKGLSWWLTKSKRDAAEHAAIMQKVFSGDQQTIALFNNELSKTPKLLAQDISKLKPSSSTRQVADYIKNLPKDQVLNTLDSYVSSQVVSGMDPSKVKDMVTAILTYTGQTDMLDVALKKIIADNKDFKTSTETYLNSLNNATSALDVTAKTYKSLTSDGKNYASSLYTMVEAISSGKLQGDRLNSVLQAISSSTQDASTQMHLLQLAAQNAGNTQMSGLLTSVQQIISDATDARSIFLGLNSLGQYDINPSDILTKYSDAKSLTDFMTSKKALTDALNAQKTKEMNAYLASIKSQNAGVDATAAMNKELTALQDQKKVVDATLKAEKDRLNIINQQNDYLNKQTDLTNQIKQAEISGNYIQAAQLTSQQSQNTAQYNAQNQINTTQSLSDSLQLTINDLTEKIQTVGAAAQKAADSISAMAGFGKLISQNAANIAQDVSNIINYWKQTHQPPTPAGPATTIGPKVKPSGHDFFGNPIYKDSNGTVITSPGYSYGPPEGIPGFVYKKYAGQQLTISFGMATEVGHRWADPSGNIFDPNGNVYNKKGAFLGRWWGYDVTDTNGTKGDAFTQTTPVIQKASGGHIRGAGTSTSDSIPAYLSNGEYVVKADAVSHYGTGFFDSVNAKKFKDGTVGGLKGLSLPGSVDSTVTSTAGAGSLSPAFEKYLNSPLGVNVKLLKDTLSSLNNSLDNLYSSKSSGKAKVLSAANVLASVLPVGGESKLGIQEVKTLISSLKGFDAVEQFIQYPMTAYNDFGAAAIAKFLDENKVTIPHGVEVFRAMSPHDLEQLKGLKVGDLWHPGTPKSFGNLTQLMKYVNAADNSSFAERQMGNWELSRISQIKAMNWRPGGGVQGILNMEEAGRPTGVLGEGLFGPNVSYKITGVPHPNDPYSGYFFEAYNAARMQKGDLKMLPGISRTYGDYLKAFTPKLANGGQIGLPSYKVGTPYVPNNQLALLHKGEAVIPANQNTGAYGGTVNVYVNATGVTDPKQITQMAQDGVMRALNIKDAKINKTNMAVRI